MLGMRAATVTGPASPAHGQTVGMHQVGPNGGDCRLDLLTDIRLRQPCGLAASIVYERQNLDAPLINAADSRLSGAPLRGIHNRLRLMPAAWPITTALHRSVSDI